MAEAPKVLSHFHPAVTAWFLARFLAPTAPQSDAWQHIRAGENVLLLAPTGSGKTLAAFLTAIDGLLRDPVAVRRAPGIRVLYISPLKALDNDVHRNLQEPLQGIVDIADRLGLPVQPPSAAVRTGDTAAAARQRQIRTPPDILITTPETLFILLTSPRAQHILASVETVIVDEIHAIAGTKRGTHLALSLERLDRLVGGRAAARRGAPGGEAGDAARAPQRIGLSATQRPLDLVADFLGGRHAVTVLDHSAPRPMDLRVSVPVPDFRDLPGDSVWDSIAPQVLADVLAHRTTLVFVPGRGTAESLTRRLNALAGREIARAHHGSVSREARQEVEAALKAGTLPALCATGTLELGIDVGAIDYVVMVGSPGSAARGLQRLGRAGHSVGATSSGRIICRTPLDLAEAGILSRDMCRGQIETTRIPARSLDVLAQHLVSMGAVAEWSPGEMLDLARGATPYRDLTGADFTSVLELVSGRYPAERFAGLRARLHWDREANVVRGRPGAGRAAISGVGTIPDRGLFAVYGPDGARVGELDEEFVHESRKGDVFVLGTTAWRIGAITADRVLVSPGAGGMPRVPFWHGEGPGRPYAVGQALARFFGEAEAGGEEWWAERARESRLEPEALLALRRLVREQAETGCLPAAERVVLEWYRDPLGDFRLAVHAPFGRAVTVPWGIALRALLKREAGVTGDMAATDGGCLFRVPARAGLPPLDLLTRWSPRALEAALLEELPRTAVFAARFRECAGRALLLARGDGRKRVPLWLQRLQSADLLAVARRYPDFPIVREALRECLEDHFDLAAWRTVLADVAARRLAVAVRERPGPSPFAAEMEFQFKATALYKPDGPRAEAATADLASLEEEPSGPYLARAEAAVASRLWGRARSGDEVHDRFLRVGMLFRDEVPEQHLLPALLEAGRVVEVDGGLIAAEERDLWRMATEGDAGARGRFVLRWAAAVPAVTAEAVRERFGWEGEDLEALGLQVLPDGRFSHPEVRRMVRRRALALARAEVAPVARGTFVEFVRRRQAGGQLSETLSRLQGVFLPLKTWIEQLLPMKVAGFRIPDLERLVNRGEILWVGRGDAVAFYAREDYPALAPTPADAGDLLPAGAALWFADLQSRSGLDGEALDRRLRELAAAGAAANDSLEPLLVAPGPRHRAVGSRWSALPPALPTAAAWAEQLLGRYGVVARAVWDLAAPPIPWSAGAEALAATGARRGYYVRGLGGLQFARGAEVDGLRETRPGGAVLLAAVDPACAYRDVPRRAGNFLVAVDGTPALQVSGGGRRVRPLRGLDGAALAAAVAALRDLPAPRGRVEIAEWDGAPVLDAPAVEALVAAGFTRGPTTLRWRRG